MVQNLSDKERKLQEVQHTYKTLKEIYTDTTTKIVEERKKLDDAAQRNAELRQMLKFLTQQPTTDKT